MCLSQCLDPLSKIVRLVKSVRQLHCISFWVSQKIQCDSTLEAKNNSWSISVTCFKPSDHYALLDDQRTQSVAHQSHKYHLIKSKGYSLMMYHVLVLFLLMLPISLFSNLNIHFDDYIICYLGQGSVFLCLPL